MSNAWLYFTDDFSVPDDVFISENIVNLPLFRQEKCSRYRLNKDKRACIMSYRLLEKGLSEQYGLEYGGGFVYNKYGKPYLMDHPHIFFSLSHCKYGIVCALADIEVGIDIQDIRNFEIDIAKRVCSEDELRELSVSAEPSRLFCKFWTEKESYAKAEGLSVFTMLKKALPKDRAFYRETEKYCMSLCCKGDLQDVTCRFIDSG